MRITVFHPSDESYGADRVLIQRVHDLIKGGHTVEVLLPTDVDFDGHPVCDAITRLGGAARHLDLPVLRREYLRVTRVWILFLRLMRSSQAIYSAARRSDLVYLNTSAMLLLAPIAALASRPTVLHLHEYWRSREALILNVLTLPCTKVIAVSRAILLPLSSTNRNKAEVIYNGLPDRSPTSPRKGRHPTILMASRWNDWKGHRTLASAWRDGIGDWRLVILGGPPPSGASVDVRELFHDATNVTVVGEVADTDPYILDADVIVVPSDLPDPLPTIAIEALRAGRPVLGAKHGGLEEILGEDAGWLFRAQDSTDLRGAISGLSQHDVLIRGKAARDRFLRLFEESVNRSRYEEALNSVVAADRQRHKNDRRDSMTSRRSPPN